MIYRNNVKQDNQPFYIDSYVYYYIACFGCTPEKN